MVVEFITFMGKFYYIYGQILLHLWLVFLLHLWLKVITFMVSITFIVNFYYIYGWYYIYGFYYIYGWYIPHCLFLPDVAMGINSVERSGWVWQIQIFRASPFRVFAIFFFWKLDLGLANLR